MIRLNCCTCDDIGFATTQPEADELAVLHTRETGHVVITMGSKR